MENHEFGRRARERRELLGLSQKAVADLVGISQPAIVKIERGGSTTTTNGFALAAALDTTLEWLEFGVTVEIQGPAGWSRLDEAGKAKTEAFISGLLAQSVDKHSVDDDRPTGDLRKNKSRALRG
ncbi:helix-turn-helix transcriptional regulator [Burkholderia gladioli]|uniref:helix-turn-helix transcriptional regulator n=1 Tax=Burkholderia gladioli TaxID=28095 RepID=UPI0005A9FFD8|nr:helix-turn-helix transcriptional regulator [Burkholderia gladioli]ASD79133.1 transcriptional regulator [Burkholderia gladioli pv. gladioli]AWY55625.1 transcriptional regulator [Burkholderia gladioli pv. gladioli]